MPAAGRVGLPRLSTAARGIQAQFSTMIPSHQSHVFNTTTPLGRRALRLARRWLSQRNLSGQETGRSPRSTPGTEKFKRGRGCLHLANFSRSWQVRSDTTRRLLQLNVAWPGESNRRHDLVARALTQSRPPNVSDQFAPTPRYSPAPIYSVGRLHAARVGDLPCSFLHRSRDAQRGRRLRHRI